MPDLPVCYWIGLACACLLNVALVVWMATHDDTRRR